MTVTQYLDGIKERLLSDVLIRTFRITRERVTLVDGYLRARLTLRDGSLLEFSEYVQHFPADEIRVVTYSYHWGDARGDLIRRWDNTPHFPGLPGFPHHIHEGDTNEVLPGHPVNVFVVLDEIAQYLA